MSDPNSGSDLTCRTKCRPMVSVAKPPLDTFFVKDDGLHEQGVTYESPVDSLPRATIPDR